MVRVLQLLSTIGPGGAEIWLLNMLREMDRRDCAIDFCLRAPEAGGLASVATDLGASVHANPLTPMHVGYMRRLDTIIRDGRYDVVHSHEMTYSWIGVHVARRLGVPIVCTFHHWHSPPQVPLTQLPGVRSLREVYTQLSVAYSLRRATYITTLSRAVMSRLAPRYETATNCRELRLSATILEPPSTLVRDELRREFGWSAETPVVIHAGRFQEQKNHDGLLDVFHRVLAVIPGAKLLLTGVGPLLGSIQARIARESLTASVRYLGLRNDLPRLLNGSDVLLFPSRDEGFGLVALEANAAGIPVVGSRIPGLDEAVVDGETALLHDCADIDAMARSVVRFLSDREYAAKIGAAGRERAQSEYSHAASAARLRALYAECVASRSAARAP